MMTKQQAVDIFGGKAVYLANALGKGKSAISQWPDILDQDKTNLVIGAATRKGIKLPKALIKAA